MRPKTRNCGNFAIENIFIELYNILSNYCLVILITWLFFFQTHHTSHTQKQENKITITLIAVVVLFVFCQIPTATLLIIKSVHNPPDYSNMGKLFLALGNIFNFLVTVNAASNFLLYCAFSAKYRRTLATIFLAKCGVSTLLNSIIPESG